MALAQKFAAKALSIGITTLVMMETTLMEMDAQAPVRLNQDTLVRGVIPRHTTTAMRFVEMVLTSVFSGVMMATTSREMAAIPFVI